MDIGGSKLDLLTRLLSASTLRSQVIAGNISNSNTPGFVRKDVQFEDQLREAMQDSSATASRITPTISDDQSGMKGPDGNNVSMETEMNAMRENRLTYETYSTILEGHFNLIDAAIRDGR
ncbi:MAG: flagellar basal body rod protein FlgB [Planctomycetota bacterium]|jgi:flagellar basal-body rod protein FlgB|nr:flagellar basal body rod protein FlgB [Planctomycetota bacterium]